MKHRVTARIDLNRIARNYNHIKSLVGDSRVMAVVKADAYGHGATRISEELYKLGCRDFAVACLDEAKELREAGIKGNILILGPTAVKLIPEVIAGDFIQTVDSPEYAYEISKKGRARIHIKIDTGMSRLGIYCHSEADIKESTDKIEQIAGYDNLSIEGIFTHFADSDGENAAFTEKQFSLFQAVIAEAESRGIKLGVKHCCNSAGIIRFPKMHLDMVRAGIILYGLMPSQYIEDEGIGLAMTLAARISAIHELKAGDTVSYGCAYTAEKDTRVAVVSVGYADGFSRVYSGKELIKIKGKKYKTLGRICMDMCVVEIGDDNIEIGDEAYIFASSEDIDRLAETLGTINYEILCSLKNRVKLEYLDYND